ncbi:hypothetical protein [Psychrobacter sp.]|uniref:hypothetical protein n=1 Tax=Psychrobacter sp. TaxID=56811 RepID=UPI003565D7D0
MKDSVKSLDNDEQGVDQLVDDINFRADHSPDSLAEATTAPLADDALGGTASEDDVNNKSRE